MLTAECQTFSDLYVIYKSHTLSQKVSHETGTNNHSFWQIQIQHLTSADTERRESSQAWTFELN